MTASTPSGPRVVTMTVAQDGTMTVSVDGLRLLPAVGVWRRESYPHVVDHATAHRRLPAVVEVHETDGTTFTEHLPAVTRGAAPLAAPVRVAGTGFLPGEPVAVLPAAVHVTADRGGRVEAVLEVPAGGPGGVEVLLFGRTSGTVHVAAVA